jgi:5-methylcytosine-specific restriction endonuclease McrA
MTRISDRRLVARLESLVARERDTTLNILRHLNEVERRGVHLSMGYASMFDFAKRRLGYSESAAGRHLQVARCIRKHPEIVALLRRNEVNLSSIGVISRVITAENSAALLDAIRKKSCREVEAVAAAYHPMVRIRDRVSPVSVLVPGAASGPPGQREGDCGPGLFESRSATADASRVGCSAGIGDRPAGAPAGEGDGGSGPAGDRARGERAGDRTGASSEDTAPRTMAKAEEKFRFQFAAGPVFVRKFEVVRALLSTRFPKGASFEQVFEATLDSFLERHSPARRNERRERRRMRTRSSERAGRTGNLERSGTCSPSREPRSPVRSRHVPAAVRDAVYARDGGQCTYVGADGSRCGSTHHLQIDHVTPFGRGGPTTTENLRLLCAAHNGLEAERAYGADWMRRFLPGAGGRTPG